MQLATLLPSALLVASIVSPMGHAAAQRPDPHAGLRSTEREAVVAAIDAVGADKSQRAVNALRDRIAEGLPPELLDHAVDTLVAIGRGPGSRVLVELARHRRAEVRTKVAEALVRVGAPNARQTLSAMLDDPSAAVRTAAAHAIGEMGARPAMRELVVASTRGLGEATAIVGAQASPADVTRILRDVNATTLGTYAPLLRAFAKRADLPLRTRSAVLEQLVALATPGSHTLLEQLVNEIPESDALHQPAVEALGELRQREEEGGEAASTPASTPSPARSPAPAPAPAPAPRAPATEAE